ncbi:MAG: hypothetical protein AAF371_19620 [Pseudomonadota bacterium]
MDLLVLLVIAMASQEAEPAAVPTPALAVPPPGSTRLVACLAARSARCGCPPGVVPDASSAGCYHAGEAVTADKGPLARP